MSKQKICNTEGWVGGSSHVAALSKQKCMSTSRAVPRATVAMDINDSAPELESSYSSPACSTAAVQSVVPIPSHFAISPIVLSKDNKSECGYAVNHFVILDSDSELPSDPESSAAEASSLGSIVDFGKSDVERLKIKTESLSLYAQTQIKNSAVEWMEAESSRSLGYNRHSSQTKKR